MNALLKRTEGEFWPSRNYLGSSYSAEKRMLDGSLYLCCHHKVNLSVIRIEIRCDTNTTACYVFSSLSFVLLEKNQSPGPCKSLNEVSFMETAWYNKVFEFGLNRDQHSISENRGKTKTARLSLWKRSNQAYLSVFLLSQSSRFQSAIAELVCLLEEILLRV